MENKHITTTSATTSDSKAAEESEDKKFELQNSAGDLLKGGGEIGHYILRLFGKKDPNKPKSFNLTIMHGINRISFIMFILALLYLIGRRIF